MDTIFVKNVKDDGPAHRAGLRTGEVSPVCSSLYFSGSLLPTLSLGWDSQILALSSTPGIGVLRRNLCHPSACSRCDPAPFLQETGW